MNAVAIFGASGAIGGAFVDAISDTYPDAKIYAFSRTKKEFDRCNVHSLCVDISDERSIEKAAQSIDSKLDLVVIGTGMLHGYDVAPEKSLKELSSDKFEELFAINTIGPALLIKHFAPKLTRKNKSVLAALSARVGSINDNRLGGWYAYRASKAALNMIIKTASIEVARRNENAVLIGLHPGTVDSELSKPFQGNVPKNKLFEPKHSVSMMLDVIGRVSAEDSGFVFDYGGERIEF